MATGPIHRKVEWEAEPAILGEQLRAVFRVRLDTNMEPTVGWLIPKPKKAPARKPASRPAAGGG